jgi:hypothetical protein
LRILQIKDDCHSSFQKRIVLFKRELNASVLILFRAVKLDLANVKAKLSRGQEHAQTVKNEVRAWMDRHPYSLTKQANANCTRYSLILRENEPPPLRRWTLIIGDCIHNFRCALDYLVYAVAVCEAGTDPPPYERCLAFPITDCRNDFDDSVRRRMLGSISDPVRTVFELLQPYNRSHPTLPPVLAILRSFNNADKHRLISLVYGTTGSGETGFGGVSPPGAKWKPVINTGELKDGAEVCAMICDRPAPNMDFNDPIGVEVNISLWHGKRDPSGPDGSERSDFSALLDVMAEEVRKVIYTFSKIS